jgi:hypothetical protein
MRLRGRAKRRDGDGRDPQRVPTITVALMKESDKEGIVNLNLGGHRQKQLSPTGRNS